MEHIMFSPYNAVQIIAHRTDNHDNPDDWVYIDPADRDEEDNDDEYYDDDDDDDVEENDDFDVRDSDEVSCEYDEYE